MFRVGKEMANPARNAVQTKILAVRGNVSVNLVTTTKNSFQLQGPPAHKQLTALQIKLAVRIRQRTEKLRVIQCRARGTQNDSENAAE
jgi:hypothetical protein